MCRYVLHVCDVSWKVFFIVHNRRRFGIRPIFAFICLQVFALGRAQELFILIERFWERFDLRYPVFFTPGLAEKAVAYYRLVVSFITPR